MKKLLIVIAALGSIHPLLAGPGDAGAAFLKIPVDARICALGEAGACAADGAAALYYNPAGLNRIAKGSVLFMHNSWIAGMFHEYFAAGLRIRTLGVLGLSFNYAGCGTIDRITIRGDTIGEFTASDWTAGLGYGREIGPVNFGAVIKYVSERNDSFGSGAFGADLGALYETPIKGLQAGLSWSNLGTSLKLDQESFGLPWLLRLGWSYRAKDLLFCQDFLASNSASLGIGLGAEYILAKVLALRLGYRTGPSYEGLSGLRAGLGIAVKNFGLDYAYAPYGKIGASHRFAISVSFK